ncbi:MAG: hypothetical protein LBD74_07480 [Spirochaetaceae bacterium]|jgi:hypothetical protein|nr:hypothetical protein [Spirochaetaceae bacterium]
MEVFTRVVVEPLVDGFYKISYWNKGGGNYHGGGGRLWGEFKPEQPFKFQKYQLTIKPVEQSNLWIGHGGPNCYQVYRDDRHVGTGVIESGRSFVKGYVELNWEKE